jgi:hypothetical protein
MSRSNFQSLIAFPDGSHLVISTQYSREGAFSCALYSAVLRPDDEAAFRVVANHLEAATCLAAQEQAYSYALRLYPNAAAVMRKPPYLIWPGPRAGLLP